MNCLVVKSTTRAASRCLLWQLKPNRFAATAIYQGDNHHQDAFGALSRCFSLSETKFYEDDFRPSEDLAKEKYQDRVGEEIEKKRARLLYQSRKRGMLENCIILSSFADKHIETLDADLLDQYDKLINLPTNDWDIYYWATNAKPTPPEYETQIMTKLREHLNTKVSNVETIQGKRESSEAETGGRATSGSEKPSLDDSVYFPKPPRRTSLRVPDYTKMRPEDIIMQPVKTNYDLEPDMRAISTTDYDKELFDNRVKQYPGRQSVPSMTNWRRDFFKIRLKRTLSQPVSLRNLSDDKPVEVFTQHSKEIDIAKQNIARDDMIDTKYERSIKHHNFMQYLFGSSRLTDNVMDYDDEAKAWAELIWNRNYGRSDISISPSSVKCRCGKANLHCCDTSAPGFVPKERLAEIHSLENKFLDLTCQKCKFIAKYDAHLSLTVNQDSFKQVLATIRRNKRSVVVYLVDLTDFPSGIWEGLSDHVGANSNRVIVVGNKLDLLPYDGKNMHSRVLESFRRNLQKMRPNEINLQINDVHLVSARTSFGVPGLMARLIQYTEDPTDMYIVGCTNSGKSTLFSALMQTDLSAIRENDLLTRVAKHKWQLGDQETNMLKFPINNPDGWEVVMKKYRCLLTERDTEAYERSLGNLSRIRQADMPQQSILENHLDYPSISSDQQEAKIDDDKSTSLIEQNKLENPHECKTSDALPRFTDDHPLSKVNLNYKPLLSDDDVKENFADHGFFHMTPSVTSPDQLHDLLTLEEKLLVMPNHETMIPRRYTLRPLQTLFISGLARLDLVTATSFAYVTVFASKYLPIHVIATRKADKFYETFLGTPFLGVPIASDDDPNRLDRWPPLVNNPKDILINCNYRTGTGTDIVLSSAGWAMINMQPDRECIVRAYTPDARGIYARYPPLLRHSRRLVGSKKIRDTPLFKHRLFDDQRTAMN